MDLFKILNIVGLSLDVVGVLLMFLYTPKVDLNTGGFLHTRDSYGINNIKSKKLNIVIKIGICSIVIGFVLQIISAIFSD